MNLRVLVYRTYRVFLRNLKKMRIGFHWEVCYSHDLENISNSFEINDNLKIQLIEPFSYAPLEEVWNINRGQLKKRWASGHSECFISLFNGMPISYHWVQYEGVHFVQQAGLNISFLGVKSAIIYHVRVAEQYRGQGIGSAVYLYILKYLKKKGFGRALIYTSLENEANKRSLEKLGFTEDFRLLSIYMGDKFYALKNKRKLKEWLM